MDIKWLLGIGYINGSIVMRKKIVHLLVIFIVVFLECNIVAYAYKPSPFLVLEVNPKDLPQDTAYIDLLIPISPSHESFIDRKTESQYVTDIVGSSIIEISPKSEISNYEKTYYSYLFHFKESTISLYAAEDNQNPLIYFGEHQKLLDEYLRKVENFKLAFVDNQGNIIKVSDEISIKSFLFQDFSRLKVENAEVVAEYTTSYSNIMFGCVSGGISIIICIVVIIRKSGDSSPIVTRN